VAISVEASAIRPRFLENLAEWIRWLLVRGGGCQMTALTLKSASRAYSIGKGTSIAVQHREIN
jgi:hypothetical protein